MVGVITVIYRVSGQRPKGGRRETYSELRRVWPAAQRAARRMEAWGYDPVTITAAVIPDDKWLRVDGDDCG